MNSDEWYVEGVKAMNAEASRQHAEAEVQAQQEIGGEGDQVEGYDLGAMKLAGLPMDGTTEPRYKRQTIGEFDSQSGANLLAPPADDWLERYRSSMDERKASATERAEEAGRVGMSAAWNLARGIVNFSADTAEAFGELPENTFRMQNMEEAGIAPQSSLGRLVANAAPYFAALAAAYSRLSFLSSTPRTALGKAAGGGARVVTASAATDAVVSDPREDTLYDAFRSMWGLEGAIGPVARRYPMLGRAYMAGEGALAGAAIGTGAKGLKMLWDSAGSLRQVAATALSKARGNLNGGLDEGAEGWLTVYFGSLIMQGERVLNDDMIDGLVATKATQTQIHQAWNRAAKLAQKAAADGTRTAE